MTSFRGRPFQTQKKPKNYSKSVIDDAGVIFPMLHSHTTFWFAAKPQNTFDKWETCHEISNWPMKYGIFVVTIQAVPNEVFTGSRHLQKKIQHN